jgi:hypothetical protein
MTALERIEYDRAAAQLRTIMDEAELKRRWAEGGGMRSDEAIAFALEK